MLLRAAAYGAVGCAELAEMASAVAGKDKPTELAGGRLERLCALTESIERLRANPMFSVASPSAVTNPEAAFSCITSAAGLVRLALMTA